MKRKLDKEAVADIRQMLADGATIGIVAEKYDVSDRHVRLIGKNKRRVPRTKGNRFTDKEIAVMRKLLAMGTPQKRVAEIFDTYQSYVSMVATNKRWKQ